MVVEPTGALDLFTLLVGYIFGNFWITIIGLAAIMFLIMGWLGRISIYSCMWMLMCFAAIMAFGYGVTIVSTLILTAIVLAFIYSLIGYINRGGQ